MNTLAHTALRTACILSKKKFASALSNPTAAQKDVFTTLQAMNPSLQNIHSIVEFQEAVPITTYNDWQQTIENALATNHSINDSPLKYFQPTSGSTAQEKWIPYTQAFVAELNRASLTWISDIYNQFPKTRKAKHYWSLSWLPDNVRHKRSNDDLDVVNPVERVLLKQVMAMPWDISRFPSSHTSVLATAIALLMCEELSMISIWSPTFLLSLLEFIKEHQHELIQLIESDSWLHYSSELNDYDFPVVNAKNLSLLKNWNGKDEAVFTQLWPNLGLISCWDSATSTDWANDIKKIFPDVPFQGKGLWATEGVVTFPFKEKMPIAITSHFYEFRCLDTGIILTVDQLELHQEVQPILSTGSGLLRFQMEDRVKVTGFLEKTPCLTFLGRIKEVDMVGEKMSHALAESILKNIDDNCNTQSLCLIAQKECKPPRYRLLQKKCDQPLEEISKKLESQLSESFHYRLARELNQLSAADVIAVEDPWYYYQQLQISAGKIEGNIKHEPIIMI